jgi:hypothetical protein
MKPDLFGPVVGKVTRGGTGGGVVGVPAAKATSGIEVGFSDASARTDVETAAVRVAMVSTMASPGIRW